MLYVLWPKPQRWMVFNDLPYMQRTYLVHGEPGGRRGEGGDG